MRVRILNLVRVNLTPVSGRRDFEKIVERGNIAFVHLRYRLVPLFPFWTIISLLPPLSSSAHVDLRRVRKWLELSNVKCKAQYYRIRPQSFASLSRISFLFPSRALSPTRYDKTWTVNQSSHTGSDFHIFYYFIRKLCAVSIRRKTRRVRYNNVEALRSYKSDGEILCRFLSLFSSFMGTISRGGKAEKFDEAFLLGFSYGRLN